MNCITYFMPRDKTYILDDYNQKAVDRYIKKLKADGGKVPGTIKNHDIACRYLFNSLLDTFYVPSKSLEEKDRAQKQEWIKTIYKQFAQSKWHVADSDKKRIMLAKMICEDEKDSAEKFERTLKALLGIY